MSTPDGTEYKDEAVYDCDPGFELGGCDRRICLSSGSWSGNVPTCEQIGRPSMRQTSKSFYKKLATLKQSMSNLQIIVINI